MTTFERAEDVDTTKVRYFYRPTGRFLAMLVLTAVLTAVGLSQILLQPTIHREGDGYLLGWLLFLPGSVFILIGIARLIWEPRQCVTLSPAGFSDRRRFEGVLPWDGITEVRTIKMYRTRYSLALHLDPVASANLQFMLVGRFPKFFGLSLQGRRKVYFGALDLDVPNNDALHLLKAYIQAHNPKAKVMS
jgi:hypothetical protein